MLRERLDAFCEGLPRATDKHVAVDVDIVHETAKAVLVETMTGAHAKRQWLPKSQLAAVDRGGAFGQGVAVKRSWIARQKLWWMV